MAGRTHPQDSDEKRRFRTVYLGGAGVVQALDSLQRRGLVELRRDYVPYLERRYEPDFPDDNHERSLWMGETGIRLALHRLSPSRENADRLAELIAERRGRAPRGEVGQSRNNACCRCHARADRRGEVMSCGSSVPAPSQCIRSPRSPALAPNSAAAATRSGLAIQEQRSTSPTVWPTAAPFRCRNRYRASRRAAPLAEPLRRLQPLCQSPGGCPP